MDSTAEEDLNTMARIKEKRKKKRMLRRVGQLCLLLAVLFAAAKGAALVRDSGLTALGQTAMRKLSEQTLLGRLAGSEKEPEGAANTEAVAAVLTETETYPQEYLDALENNPELLDFVLGYPDAETIAAGGLKKKEIRADMPLLLQWDKRWGYVPYGDHNIGLSGCAPTCLSMVVVGLTKNGDASPDAVAAYAEENGYYLYGTGTKWSLMTEGALHFGVRGTELALDKNRMFEALEQGHPIICSVRPGDFTKGGHFLVLVGVEDGKIRLNDPNSRIRSNKLWDYETLAPQIKSLWEFTVE